MSNNLLLLTYQRYEGLYKMCCSQQEQDINLFTEIINKCDLLNRESMIYFICCIRLLVARDISDYKIPNISIPLGLDYLYINCPDKMQLLREATNNLNLFPTSRIGYLLPNSTNNYDKSLLYRTAKEEFEITNNLINEQKDFFAHM